MLKLAALDEEDLAVMSAHMQDAVLRVGDLVFRPKHRQFALVANRFAWDEQNQRQRRRTGLHFDRVLKAEARNIRMDDKDAILSLLSIGFEQTDAPSGTILLTFSGGGTIRLTAECLEAQLLDLGPAWTTPNQPSHPDDETKAP